MSVNPMLRTVDHVSIIPHLELIGLNAWLTNKVVFKIIICFNAFVCEESISLEAKQSLSLANL